MIKKINIKTNIPKLSDDFENSVGSYTGYFTCGSKYKHMPNQELIALFNKFQLIGRTDIPIKILCASIESSFSLHDSTSGMRGVNEQILEGQFRFLSVMKGISDDIKYKLLYYIDEANTRVRKSDNRDYFRDELKKEILEDPFNPY